VRILTVSNIRPPLLSLHKFASRHHFCRLNLAVTAIRRAKMIGLMEA
jgi:hypothetical protein